MRIKGIKTGILVLLLILAGTAGEVSAQGGAFQVTIDRNRIPLGSSAQLTLEFSGGIDPGALELPEVDGFQTRYLGPSTKVTISNGNYSKTTSYAYSLFPLKIGSFHFPALKVEVDGRAYVSQAIPIEVTDAQSQSSAVSSSSQGQGQQGQEASAKLEDRIFLQMTLGKKEAYLHEKVPVTFKLYVQGLSVSDISYPEWEEGKGFSVDEFEKPPRQYEEVRGGLRYDVVEFNTVLYPTRSGKLSIGPADLQCSIVSESQRKSRSPFGHFDDFFDGFFDRVSKHPIVLKSSGEVLNVLPLPQAGQPEHFSGAVGQYQFDLKASPLDVKAGDPVTIRMFFSGTGDLNAVTFPSFQESEQFKVYDPQIKESNGVKILEQVIVPKDASVKEIPSVSFIYFDTRLGKYQTIVKEPVPLHVSPADHAGELSVFAPEQEKAAPAVPEKIGQDIVYIKERPGRFRNINDGFYKSIKAKAGFGGITLLFILGWAYYRHRSRLGSDVAYARRLKAPGQAREGLKQARGFVQQEKSKEFYLAVFKTLQDYFGNKYHLPSQGLTARELEKVLKEKKTDPQTLIELKELFELCDRARFASVQVHSQEMTDSLKRVERLIDHFERNAP